MCWHGRCHYCPLNCNYVLIANNADDFCSEQAENDSKTYDFGVFKDALPILNSRDFIWKISYCFWWSLQKLRFFFSHLVVSDKLILLLCDNSFSYVQLFWSRPENQWTFVRNLLCNHHYHFWLGIICTSYRKFAGQ